MGVRARAAGFDGRRTRVPQIITQPPGVGDYFADGQRLCQLAAVNDPRGEYVIAEDCQSEALFTIRLRDLSRRWWKITPRA